MTWQIPRTSGVPLKITLEGGRRVFILGPNGSGKSALVQHLARHSIGRPIQRISAHRRTWLSSGTIDFTPTSRKNWAANSQHYEKQPSSRWLDHDPASRQSAILFDLISQDNDRARSIASRVDSHDWDGAKYLSSKTSSPFDTLNELLEIGTLSVKISNSKGEEIIACHRSSQSKFDIARMSDGERSAVILAANVLTADKDTVFVIDEPERHLHRAIIEPFLSAVFSQRPDCSFVISTHEIAMPAIDPDCTVLMVRSCKWSGDLATEWEIDLLPSGSLIPEELRHAILGSRRTLLFVEGTLNSLDCRLYRALFPTISVIPVGTARDVQDAVKGLHETSDVHHIRAFGIIDGDDRPPDSIKKLAKDGVYVLGMLCVEGLYYCSDSIAAVASHQAGASDLDDDQIITSAHGKALTVLRDEQLAIRMAARRSERIIRRRVLSEIPSWQSIQSDLHRHISFTVSSPVQDEIRRYHGLVADGDLDGIVCRYSIRESRAFDCIAKELRFRSRGDYCRMVVSRIRESDSLRAKLRSRVDTLARAIDESGDSIAIDS